MQIVSGRLTGNMDSLKDVLAKLLKSTPNYKENLLRSQVYDAWPRLVGEKVARHCWPIKLLPDGTLLIGAESSAWLQSLRYLEAQILEKFERELKGRKVKSLRYKLETRPSDR